MASAGRGEPRCSFEIADKIVTLLRNDEEARGRWNNLLGRGISASMRDTFLSYRNGRRAEYQHKPSISKYSGAVKMDRLCSKLSRARIVS